MAIVKVVVADGAIAPLRLIGDTTVHVGGPLKLPSMAVTVQLRFTAPVKPNMGESVIVAVLPAVAPGTSEIFPLLVNTNPGVPTVTGSADEVDGEKYASPS